MNNPTVEKQAKNLIYELKNCANEYGFKVEGWKLSMGTVAEKEKLEKKYYPFFSLKVQPELLPGICITINKILRLGSEIKEQSSINQNLQYLIAFNPARIR